MDPVDEISPNYVDDEVVDMDIDTISSESSMVDSENDSASSNIHVVKDDKKLQRNGRSSRNAQVTTKQNTRKRRPGRPARSATKGNSSNKTNSGAKVKAKSKAKTKAATKAKVNTDTNTNTNTNTHTNTNANAKGKQKRKHSETKDELVVPGDENLNGTNLLFSGKTGSRNAYMLVYRKRSAATKYTPDPVPEALAKDVENHNIAFRDKVAEYSQKFGLYKEFAAERKEKYKELFQYKEYPPYQYQNSDGEDDFCWVPTDYLSSWITGSFSQLSFEKYIYV